MKTNIPFNSPPGVVLRSYTKNQTPQREAPYCVFIVKYYTPKVVLIYKGRQTASAFQRIQMENALTCFLINKYEKLLLVFQKKGDGDPGRSYTRVFYLIARMNALGVWPVTFRKALEKVFLER